MLSLLGVTPSLRGGGSSFLRIQTLLLDGKPLFQGGMRGLCEIGIGNGLRKGSVGLTQPILFIFPNRSCDSKSLP
jgi:hypothetical protein